MDEPVETLGVFRLMRQLRLADDLAEAGPLRWRRHADAEDSVLRLPRSGRIAPAENIDAGARARKPAFQRIQGVELRHLQQRFVDVGAIAPRAVLAVVERGEARNEGGQSGEHGGLAVASEHRRPFDRADQFHHSGEAARDRLARMVAAIGAGVGEP